MMADNHRTICNMTPNNMVQSYTSDEVFYKDVYTIEKAETKQGWSDVMSDEGRATGRQREINAFCQAAAYGGPIESDNLLAADTITVVYPAYLSAERKGAEVMIESR